MRFDTAEEMEGERNDSLANPFAGSQKPEKELLLKYSIWEVLKRFPAGLTASETVSELVRQNLKDFSGKRNAPGQVSGELVRHRDYFIQDPDRKVWFVRPLAPSKLLEAPRLTRSKSKRGRPSKQTHATRNAFSLADKPKGRVLVGARVSVWWAGDNTFFNGEIVAFETESNSYTVIYDDGDADNGIQFKNYEVVWKEGLVNLVRVYETDQDEMDPVGGGPADPPQLASNGVVDTTKRGEGDIVEHAAESHSRSLSDPDGNAMDVAENLEGGEVMSFEHTLPEVDNDVDGMDDGGEPQLLLNGEPAAARNSLVRTLSPTGGASRLTNKSPASTTPHHQSGQGDQLISPHQFVESAIRCAEHIAATVSAYHNQYLDLVDLYNRMRGTPPDSLGTGMVGDLAFRVETTAVDSGQFAMPIESETPGVNRFMRFCVEGFIKSAEAMDGYLLHLLEFGQQTLTQLVECIPEDRLQDVQDIMDSASPLPNEDCLQKLRRVEQQIRQLTEILSGHG